LLRVSPLTGQRLVAGRSPDVELVLASDTVSRQHLEVLRDESGRWWVRDLGSRNGTAVNGKVISSQLLAFGDVIQVEDYTLTFVRNPGDGGDIAQMASISTAPSMELTLVDSPVGPVRSLRDLGAPKIDASHISRLVALSAELLASEVAEERLTTLCKMMISDSMRGSAALAIRVATSGEAEPMLLVQPAVAVAGTPVPHISRTVLRAVVAQGSPVIASTSVNRGNKELLRLSLVVQAMSAISVPLGGTGEYLDVLYVTFPRNYATAEWLALCSLAGELYRQADAAWVARKAAQEQAILEEELERAHDIQTRLVPDDFVLAELDIGFGFEACKWVGGDYVDALPLHDGRVLITVMDVCGKGLEAALIAAGLHTTVHVLVHEGLGLAPLVSSLNRYLCETLPLASFVTMCALVIDPATGVIEHVNCGHPPPFVAGVSGGIREIATHEHAPLGFLDVDEEIVVTRDSMPHEHVLVLYTDGLSELLDESDQMLCVEGLSTLIDEVARGTRHASATELAAALRGALADYQGQAVAADDLSFILVRRAISAAMSTGPQRAASTLPPGKSL